MQRTIGRDMHRWVPLPVWFTRRRRSLLGYSVEGTGHHRQGAYKPVEKIAWLTQRLWLLVRKYRQVRCELFRYSKVRSRDDGPAAATSFGVHLVGPRECRMCA